MDVHPKTVFITSFHPLISRNIIGTSVIRGLVERGCRVVIIVPIYKVAYFRERYGIPGVTIEGVETGPSIRTKRVGIFKRLAEAMPNTERAAIGRKRTLTGNLKSPVRYFLFYVPAGFFGRFRWFVGFVRGLDFYFSPRGRFKGLLAKHRPSLVFSTDAQNENDVALMQDARRAGIPSIGMVRSWDNLTTRMLRFVPERVIVHNEIIRDEAVHVQGVPRDQITVLGIPHYDKYFKDTPLEKKAFLESIGANPEKPLILYIPLCDYRLAKNNVDRFVMEILSGFDATTVVRFPPAETVSIEGFVKPTNVLFDRPGHVFTDANVGDRDLTSEDDTRYMNLLASADVVIGGPSTFVIDAALFDTPIVLVDFYPEEVSDGERIYEYGAEHFERILKTGGVRRTRTKEEFMKWVKEYFKNASIDHEGRARIVQEQCGATDGGASARLVKAILSSVR